MCLQLVEEKQFYNVRRKKNKIRGHFNDTLNWWNEVKMYNLIGLKFYSKKQQQFMEIVSEYYIHGISMC